MRNCGIAILVSLGLHALIAVALILYLDYAPDPDALVQLDLSSVEMSFAETVTETAAAIASAPSRPAPPPVDTEQPSEARQPEVAHCVKQNQPPLPVDAVSAPQPPTLDEPLLREPVEPLANMQTPPPPPMPRPSPPKPTPKKETPPQSTPAAASALSASSAPRQARVDAPAHLRRNIKPDYPRGARQRGEQGDVRLEISVASDGTVSEAHIFSSSGFAELDESALNAVRHARFVPAKSDGRPVASTARITLTFKLK